MYIRNTGKLSIACQTQILSGQELYIPCTKDSGPLSQMAINSKTNPSPDHNRYRRRCPDPNARIQYRKIITVQLDI